MNDSTPSLKLTDSEQDRRREVRDPAQLKVTLNTPGQPSREVLTKDQSFSGISFIIEESLSLGQDCHVALENADHTYVRFLAKVIRSRSLPEGGYEIAVQFRRQIAA